MSQESEFGNSASGGEANRPSSKKKDASVSQTQDFPFFWWGRKFFLPMSAPPTNILVTGKNGSIIRGNKPIKPLPFWFNNEPSLVCYPLAWFGGPRFARDEKQ